MGNGVHNKLNHANREEEKVRGRRRDVHQLCWITPTIRVLLVPMQMKRNHPKGSLCYPCRPWVVSRVNFYLTFRRFVHGVHWCCWFTRNTLNSPSPPPHPRTKIEKSVIIKLNGIKLNDWCTFLSEFWHFARWTLFLDLPLYLNLSQISPPPPPPSA